MIIYLSIQLLHSKTEDENSTFVYAAINGELVWKEVREREGHIDTSQMASSCYSPGYLCVRQKTIGLNYLSAGEKMS